MKMIPEELCLHCIVGTIVLEWLKEDEKRPVADAMQKLCEVMAEITLSVTGTKDLDAKIAFIHTIVDASMLHALEKYRRVQAKNEGQKDDTLRSDREEQ